MPMLQAILLSAGDFARGALHAKIFPEPIRMQLLDFYSRADEYRRIIENMHPWTENVLSHAVMPGLLSIVMLSSA